MASNGIVYAKNELVANAICLGSKNINKHSRGTRSKIVAVFLLRRPFEGKMAAAFFAQGAAQGQNSGSFFCIAELVQKKLGHMQKKLLATEAIWCRNGSILDQDCLQERCSMPNIEN